MDEGDNHDDDDDDYIIFAIVKMIVRTKGEGTASA